MTQVFSHPDQAWSALPGWLGHHGARDPGRDSAPYKYGILLHVELNPPEVVFAHLSSLSCTFLPLVNKTGAVLALFPPPHLPTSPSPHLRDFIHCSHSLEQYFAHTSPV